jgi:hypothetical protein
MAQQELSISAVAVVAQAMVRQLAQQAAQA